MKHLKPYQIFENQEPQLEHPGFPTTEEEIHDLCRKYFITDYTINEDLSIDVDGNVNFYDKNLKYIPLNFNYVKYVFDCSRNELISLKGCPKEVGGDFSCNRNNLKSLVGSPLIARRNVYCSDNHIKNFEGGFDTIYGQLNCQGNNIVSLMGFPNVSGNILFTENPIKTLATTFIDKNNKNELIQEFNHYHITDGELVYEDRLEMFCLDYEIYMPNLFRARQYYKIV